MGSDAGAGDQTARLAEAYALGLQQVWDASGVLLVERDGAIMLERAIGVASQETHAPMATDTQFAIGSVTKEWTAWLVRDAARDGALPLDSTLDRWFPDVPSWKRITAGQLLEHRSGLIRTVPGAHEAVSPTQAAALCARAPLLFEPGTKEAYSNCGYEVLARILELATGRRFGDLLHERLLNPRGMRDSGLGPGPRLAQGYQRDHGRTVAAPPSPASGGAGGGFSTARDLCHFLLAQREQDTHPRVHKTAGKTEGFLGFLVDDTRTRTGIVYLTNQESAPVARIFEDLGKIVTGQAVDPPRLQLRRVVAGDRRLEDGLVGTFELDVDPSQKMRIERRAGQLVFIDPEGKLSALVWVAPRTLLLLAPDDHRTEVSSDAELTFPDVTGPAPEIELHILGGMRLKATRTSS